MRALRFSLIKIKIIWHPHRVAAASVDARTGEQGWGRQRNERPVGTNDRSQVNIEDIAISKAQPPPHAHNLTPFGTQHDDPDAYQ